MTVGEVDDGEPFAVFHRVVDAVVTQDRVFVLDATPPWIRVFRSDGAFLGTLVERGDGPGESNQLIGLSLTSDGLLLAASRQGVLRVDPEMGDAEASVVTGARVRGAVEGCRGAVFVLADTPGREPREAVLLRFETTDASPDTLWLGRGLRRSSSAHHTWFATANGDGIVFYTEEENRPRLLQLGCNGEVLREIEIAPLGDGERIGEERGLFMVAAPTAPHPAGVARIGDSIYWAAQHVRPRSGGVDSITVLRTFVPGGEAEEVVISGWYQILGTSPDGHLVFGNAISLRTRTWGLLPAVYLIRATHLGASSR